MIEVEVARPLDEVFAYLVDPANRPAWQSSLRRVEAVEPIDPQVGQTWVDVTTLGVRPVMRVTRLEPPEQGSAEWVEVGEWRGVSAALRLVFTAQGEATVVRAVFELSAPKPLLPVVLVLRRLAPYAVRSDLRRAARLLSGGT